MHPTRSSNGFNFIRQTFIQVQTNRALGIVSIQTSLFTKVLHQRSLEEALEYAAEIGYDGVEPMGREPHLSTDTSMERVKELAEQTDDLGLDVPCLGSYTGHYIEKDENECERELEKLQTFLEFADVLNCDLVRHGPGGPPVRDATEEDFAKATIWLRKAADLAAEYDVDLGVEIHTNTIAETTDSTLKLLDMVDRSNVGAIHDAANMWISRTEHGAQSVERLGDRLVHVHVKDEMRVDNASLPGSFEMETPSGMGTFQPKLLGEGSVDHGPLFRALFESGYDGFVTDECHVAREGERDLEVAEHELAELSRQLSRAEN
ncbi:sugar phosphate isomerase/epimerase family protein [Halorussus salinisoli]|uniref:sugar phosphate isomerase/epimerase family protein n=1 Tax=Halorussus salinisoli TaxID=2558242 RepID=UPI002A90B50D|nr:sugar phosphate isomerase/epimerase [Halorussus salinisoli]